MKLHPMHAFGTLENQIERLRVNRLEKRHHPQVPFPHKHDFFHLVIVTGGKGWHEIDFTRNPVSARAVFFMKPGQVHSWALDKSTKGYVIEFERNALESGGGFELPDFMTPDKISKRKMDELCQSMLEEYEAQKQDYESVLKLQLGTLLLWFARELPPIKAGKESSSQSLVEQFSSMVETHFRSSHSVEFYAQKLKTTPKLLTMRFTRNMGVSPRQFIQDRCLLEAKRLLAYSKLSVQEVGNQVGFEDANYFARFFHEKSGVTPTHFRDHAQMSSAKPKKPRKRKK